MSRSLSANERSRTSLRRQVRAAVIWRSGSQVIAQTLQWGATFLVIRLLAPSDYGLFAMTQTVLVLLNMLNGYGLANALVRRETVTERDVAQLFGMLIVANCGLALVQVVVAPVFAAYYRQPEVAALLRVQALLYLATPLVAVPQARLARSMEFRHQATANIVASIASATTALAGAFAGWGVWTLVAAPLVLFFVRGVGLTIAAGGPVRPSFDFRGAGAMVRYGRLVATGQLFALVWSQADVVIGGRALSPHLLGVYSTSLFLVQIFVSKFVPPLNEVAFAAYARLQREPAGVARTFLQFTHVVMIAGMPFYLGLAATADPLVLTVLGPHWVEAAPVVRVLALSMPFYTVFVLLGPATDALGRPDVAARNAMAAAVLAPVLLFLAIRWGVIGLAATWLVVFPILLAIALVRALPVIGVSGGALARVVAPPALAATAMGAVVVVVDHALPPLSSPLRLAVLVAVGAASYGAWLLVFARDAIAELRALALGRG